MHSTSQTIDHRPDLRDVLDMSALEPLVALGVLGKLGKLYLQLVPSLVEGVRAAVEEGDLATVTDICHQLKSSSANIGAIEFAGLCGQLESAAMAGDLETCRAKVAEFVAVGETALSALAVHLETVNSGA